MIYGWLKRRRDLRKSEKERATELRRERESHVPEPIFNPFGRLADAVIMQMNERNIAYEEQTQNEIRETLGNIAVISFVGSSGTGKSTRAISVAREYKIDYIIDDGLLIHGGAIIAGSSAKRAESKMESVRQALFLDPARAESMRRTLVERLPSALMVLGTSDAMLSRICENLWLNQPSIKIRIEDVSTESERNQAKQTRMSSRKTVASSADSIGRQTPMKREPRSKNSKQPSRRTVVNRSDIALGKRANNLNTVHPRP
jgi:hypothetical protein